MEPNLSEEEEEKLEKLQLIRVKFLRLVHRLGLSPYESAAAQVLRRLQDLGGRQNNQIFNLDAAKHEALQMEAEESDDLDFSVNILVIGKSGVGKSATINSIFGMEKASSNAFETGTVSVQQIYGIIDGVKVGVIDTPGLKTPVLEEGFNRSVLSSVNKFIKKNVPDVVLYVDRLDAQSNDLNDLSLMKTVTNVLGPSIWQNAKVILTHSASAPPDGPSGAPLSYEVYVSQRSNVVQQSIGHVVGNLRERSLINPVLLVENHPYCRTNWAGQKTLFNGQSWRPQLLLLCYSMKILSEVSSVSRQQDPFDLWRLFGLPRPQFFVNMLSSLLEFRPHPRVCEPVMMVSAEHLPPSFEGDNPANQDVFVDLDSSLSAGPVLESHGWDNDCGYNGVDLEQSVAIAGRFPVAYKVGITEEKKRFIMNLDSSISAEHGERVSSMAGFDAQAIGKQLTSIVLRAETKFNTLQRHKSACGVSFFVIRKHVFAGVKVEDEISLGKQYALVHSVAALRLHRDLVGYGTNFNLRRRELDDPMGKGESILGMSVTNELGVLALVGNVQLAIGRNSKVKVQGWINSDVQGKVTVTTRTCEHLSLAYLAAAVIPSVLYKKWKSVS